MVQNAYFYFTGVREMSNVKISEVSLAARRLTESARQFSDALQSQLLGGRDIVFESPELPSSRSHRAAHGYSGAHPDKQTRPSKSRKLKSARRVSLVP